MRSETKEKCTINEGTTPSLGSEAGQEEGSALGGASRRGEDWRPGKV